MRHIWLAAVAAGALALAPPQASADSWQRGFDVHGKPMVDVHTDDGSIHVTTGATNRVEVSIETRGWEIGRNEVRVTATQDGNRIEVEALTPRRWFSFNIGQRWIRIEVRVPAASDLRLHSGDGSIHVATVAGDIQATTGDGSITVRDLAGTMYFHTGDGSIRATDIDGELACETGDGRIEVAGRFDGLELHTGDGSIDAEAAPGSKVAEAWSVNTGDGPVQLWIPRALAADVEAHTGDGRIVLDLPMSVEGVVNRSHLSGHLNGGGKLLKLHSGDGSIRIAAVD